ncbi:hypothetical protein J6590_027842 [Homalodisca vitripennis]|nr:hypothetical protein J6590_027842 [Homalodisca vitripennis]
MGRAASGRVSGTPDSLSDNESSPLYSRTPRKPSTPGRRPSLTPGGSLPGSRNNSRPPSRTGSKPPSRHGSNLSLASSDDGTPSRIPRRSTASLSARSSGTATPRKLTVPTVNGSASRTRSPSGLTTSSTSTSSVKSSIPRASSIPTIASNSTPSSSRSRIPVYVGLAMLDATNTTLSSSSSSGYCSMSVACLRSFARCVVCYSHAVRSSFLLQCYTHHFLF